MACSYPMRTMSRDHSIVVGAPSGQPYLAMLDGAGGVEPVAAATTQTNPSLRSAAADPSTDAVAMQVS